MNGLAFPILNLIPSLAENAFGAISTGQAIMMMLGTGFAVGVASLFG